MVIVALVDRPLTEGRAGLPRDRLPTASEVFVGLPRALPDDGGLRESVRAMRAADGLLLGALDDDPTGSQAVHGVQVVTVLEEDAYQAAFGGAPVCFVAVGSASSRTKSAIRSLTLRGGHHTRSRSLAAVAMRDPPMHACVDLLGLH